MATVQSEVRPSESWLQPDYSAASVRNLARQPALFINNTWVNSTHGATLAVEDPSSGKEICRIVDASDADVDRAVAATRAAFDDGRWSNLPPNKRERIINKLADLIESHAAEFAELEAIDNGKPVGMAIAVDIPAAVDQLRYMAGWASKLGGDLIEPQSTPRGAFFSYWASTTNPSRRVEVHEERSASASFRKKSAHAAANEPVPMRVATVCSENPA
jgi:phenylacetaldehyde dehydrogenase